MLLLATLKRKIEKSKESLFLKSFFISFLFDLKGSIQFYEIQIFSLVFCTQKNICFKVQ